MDRGAGAGVGERRDIRIGARAVAEEQTSFPAADGRAEEAELGRDADHQAELLSRNIHFGPGKWIDWLDWAMKTLWTVRPCAACEVTA